MHLLVPPIGTTAETRRIAIGSGALTIGRAPSCEIRLDVAGVDPEHARVERLLNGVVLLALGQGCFVGDVALEPGSQRLVQSGDEVLLGSVVLRLVDERPRLDSIDMALSGIQEEGPCVRVVEGANIGAELVLSREGHPYVIGRDGAADLALEDREVSRNHLHLVRRGHQVFAIDQTSTRGSYIGRARVQPSTPTPWDRPAMLRVGATVLSLHLPASYLARNPAADAGPPLETFTVTSAPALAHSVASVPDVTTPSVPPPAAPSGSGPPRAGRDRVAKPSTATSLLVVGVLAMALIGGLVALLSQLD